MIAAAVIDAPLVTSADRLLVASAFRRKINRVIIFRLQAGSHEIAQFNEMV
jgi:hypothetical protein